MIKRDTRLILLNQTIAYKNADLEFIDFTDNLLAVAGVKHEDAILGKRDDADFPWSVYADDYQAHDREALEGKIHCAITPFVGVDDEIAGSVLCTRSKCNLDNKSVGVLIHVLPLNNPNLNELVNKLRIIDPPKLDPNYYIKRKLDTFQLTERESECLFYLLRGKSTKFIANILNISCRTIEFHIDNIKAKFSCRSKSELICTAMQKGYMTIIPDNVVNKNQVSEMM